MSNEFLWSIDNLKLLSRSDMKKMLKNIGSYSNFKTKEEYYERIQTWKNVFSFPWRKDQKEVIDEFLKFNYNKYVIHGLFGCGKTSMLLGALIQGVFKKLFKPEDVMFISYNISIKNEIKRKLKKYGIANKIVVRTFDSLIYEIAKVAGYAHIDLPNFEGKRKFVYEKTFDETFTFYPSHQPKIIFMDECQDLERQMLDILYRFYPETKFVFAGDIFQSIQKEPRESILWHYMTVDPLPTDVFKIYMYNTPRVPTNILSRLQTSLSLYYPEFREKILNWNSSNTVSNADIVWKRLNSYTHIFNDLKEYLEEPEHTPKNTMILTFSSAITVKNNIGDIGRIRKFMTENGFDVNTNHKRQDEDKYFLTTSNSSKGLERDYVIIFLTFPLERAFVHLSNDVMVNLITVALTRAKKQVIMYVPSYEDKYSDVLSIFETCPLPNQKRIREGKITKEFGFSDYIDIEHGVTDLIRASVIKYDTRIIIKEFSKPYNFGKLFDEEINYKILPIITEEDKAFVGVLIENLITSTWKGCWPFIGDADLKNNPMYHHVLGRMKRVKKKYQDFTRSHGFSNSNQFEGIYLFSQYSVAISNKVFMSINKSLYENLKTYWSHLKSKIIPIKPVIPDEGGKMTVQKPFKMPYLTGIADVSIEREREVELYEIKASKDPKYMDNALTQVLLYSLMSAKSWSRVHVLNPFMNQCTSYYFDSKKIMCLRQKVHNDILVYNLNSMMAKLYPKSRNANLPKLNVKNTMFLDVRKNEDGKVIQVSLLNVLSPIKVEFIFNEFVSSNEEKKTKEMNREDRFQVEAIMTQKEIYKKVEEILLNPMNKDKEVWCFEKDMVDNLPSVKYRFLKDEYHIPDEDSIVNFLGYKKDEDKTYSLPMDCSLTKNIFNVSFLFFNHTFV